MSHAPTPRSLLHTALRLDALASAAMGALLAAAGGALAAPFGLPELLLREAGIGLLPYAAWVWRLGTRPVVGRRAATAVIVVNLAWAVASVALLVGAPVTPTALGTAFVLLQAAVVFAFAEAQWMGLRRTAHAALA